MAELRFAGNRETGSKPFLFVLVNCMCVATGAYIFQWWFFFSFFMDGEAT
jgi:hypothetical protein